MTARISPLGERTLQVRSDEFGPSDWAALALKLRENDAALGLPGIEDIAPAERSLLLIFGTEHLPGALQRRALRAAMSAIADQENSASNVHRLPVCYAAEFAPDLLGIAKAAGLGEAEVIALHCDAKYTVQAVGFAPGFAYLGTVDARIATPRLATPRTRVPVGAVGIADARTAVYPAASPGGWNIIGRCPQRMFDARATRPGCLQVGDRVQFYAISAAEFAALDGGQ